MLTLPERIQQELKASRKHGPATGAPGRWLTVALSPEYPRTTSQFPYACEARPPWARSRFPPMASQLRFLKNVSM